MTNPFHRLLNPHCEHCSEERRESKICISCENLRLEVARLRHDNERLLNRLLDTPPEITISGREEDKIPIPPKLPWAARRQMLEREDRDTAKRLRQQQTEVAKDTISTEDLEKELDIVTAARESKNA